MDLLTQGITGALLAHAAARPAESRLAAAVGFGAGLLADADALIRSDSDPLLYLEYHRHFTHALLFVPVGALLAALLLWPILRRRISFMRLYLFTLLGYSLSGVLDACTSYGTHLFWPFSDTRVAWSVISIVDPLFTLGLLLALVVALRKRSVRAARLGLLFGCAYLVLGLVQHQRAAEVAAELAASRGHAVERGLVKPTLGNLLLWRSVYESGGRFHVDAVRVGWFSEGRVFEGTSVERFAPGDVLVEAVPGTRLRSDLRRFDLFSDGYVARAPGRPGTLGDIRYASLPNGVQPIWGIEIPDTADEPVRFRLFRDMSMETRQQFMAMLFPD